MSSVASQLTPARVTTRVDWRGAAFALAAAVAGTGAALYLTTKTTHGAGVYSIGVVVAVIAFVWMFTTRRIEVALSVAIAYLGLLDGFLRLKTGSSTLTLGRDLVFYSVAIGMLLRAILRGERFRWPPLTVWIVGWVVFVLVQLFNPASGPLLHRIVSLRQDLEFVPLFFIGYAVVQSRARLRSLLVLLLAIAAINGVVGLYQSSLSPAQLAGWGAGYNSLIYPTNGSPTLAVGPDGKPIVRPPALGGDMGFGGVIGMMALPAGLALLLLRRRKRSEVLVIGGLLILAAVGVATSESRSAILDAVIALVAFAAMLSASGEGRKVIVGMLIFGAIVAGALSVVSSSSLNRYNSIAPSKLASTVGNSRSGTFALIPKYIGRFPFGAGLGASGPAYGQYGGALNTTDGENQLTFLISEIGIPGLVLFLIMQARIIGGSVRRLRKVKDSDIRILLAALIAPLFAFVANWYGGINTVSPPNAPYMWGVFGIIAFWLFSRRGQRPATAS